MRKFRILYEARFISIIDILVKTNNWMLAVYLVRLLTGFKLLSAKKYISVTERFLNKSKNKIQYIQFK